MVKKDDVCSLFILTLKVYQKILILIERLEYDQKKLTIEDFPILPILNMYNSVVSTQY